MKGWVISSVSRVNTPGKADITWKFGTPYCDITTRKERSTHSPYELTIKKMQEDLKNG